MNKFIIILILIFPFSLIANENPKDKKIAKYVMENIQKDYVNCYSFLINMTEISGRFHIIETVGWTD